MALIIGYLRLLGAAHAQRVVFIADGAEWIWERSDRILRKPRSPPGAGSRWSTSTTKHLHDAIVGIDASARRQQYERLRHVLRRDADGVPKVRTRSARPAGSEDARIAYFERHRHRMAYAHSSEVAGGIGACGERRRTSTCASRPPAWTPETVADLMHLRAAFKCGRWPELMHRVLTQTFPVPSFARWPRDQLDTGPPHRAKEDQDTPGHATLQPVRRRA